MLDHQIEFSRAIKEIYSPISGRMSDPDSFKDEGNQAGIQACNEYEEIVKELKVTLQPELGMIQQRVIGPASELMEIIKAVRKTTLKRAHKQLDYDRHRATLKKIQEKPDKSLKDEKALFKAEAEAEQATQDYEYFNDLLKDELPKLFRLEREFVQPLFQSFYYMQLNVFYTLHERMQSIDIGYFDLSLDVEAAFNKKRGDIREETEKLTILHFKTKGSGRPGKPGVSKYAAESKYAQRRKSEDSDRMPPPPYSAEDDGESTVPVGRTRSSSLGSPFLKAAAAKAKGAAPPPPKPKPSRLAGHSVHPTATALYDYEAQAEGDLSFSAGDIIEVTVRGATENEWWQGTLKGKSGQFPGRYFVLLLSNYSLIFRRELYQDELRNEEMKSGIL